MRIDRLISAGRVFFVAALVCLSATLASCSTVGTFLSNLDPSALMGDHEGQDRKIPLPPMAEDYANSDGESDSTADGAH